MYHALDAETRKRAYLFEYDKQWSSDPHFVFFDMNRRGEDLTGHEEMYDMVVCDPPELRPKCWRDNSLAVKRIAKVCTNQETLNGNRKPPHFR